jgi:lactoylglutathione lyase
MSIVPVPGLWETHLTVADLDRSIGFYRDVVGLTLAHTVPERHAAFFWIGQRRQAMLGLWSIHTSPMAIRLHYAFQVSLNMCRPRLRRCGTPAWNRCQAAVGGRSTSRK